MRTVGLGSWCGVGGAATGLGPSVYNQCIPLSELGPDVNTHFVAGLGPNVNTKLHGLQKLLLNALSSLAVILGDCELQM